MPAGPAWRAWMAARARARTRWRCCWMPPGWRCRWERWRPGPPAPAPMRRRTGPRGWNSPRPASWCGCARAAGPLITCAGRPVTPAPARGRCRCGWTPGAGRRGYGWWSTTGRWAPRRRTGRSGMVRRAADGWSAWPAPAKLNLFLRITGRRDDGYHSLQTVFRLLDRGDTVRLRVRADGVIRRHGASPAGVPESEDLLLRAARLLQEAAGSGQGADIGVEKNIPIGGGFGGGSSNAATVLVALNRLWNAGLAPRELASLGLRLGADVPVFVHGRTAWAEGVGEKLDPLALAPAWYLLVDPGIRVATAELFQA